MKGEGGEDRRVPRVDPFETPHDDRWDDIDLPVREPTPAAPRKLKSAEPEGVGYLGRSTPGDLFVYAPYPSNRCKLCHVELHLCGCPASGPR